MASSQPTKVGNFKKVKFDYLNRFDVVYVEAYNNSCFGFIDWVDEDSAGIKTGFGKNTNFVIWQKDKPKIYKLIGVSGSSYP